MTTPREELMNEKKFCCLRCGKRLSLDEADSIEVHKSSYTLCSRCAETFIRRFNTFMARG